MTTRHKERAIAGAPIAASRAASRRVREWLTPLVSGHPRVWTFDVFDTAITRLVLQPDHLHWLVARQARARGLTRLDPEVWRSYRVAGEAAARQASAGEEVTLAEIYAQIERQLRGSDALLSRLAALELQLEQALVRPIAATRTRVADLRTTGNRTAFVSDTYLAASTVTAMLHGCGYDIDAGDVVVSSAQGASKARGDLYQRVADSYGVACGEISHRGDNRRTDVVNARRAGVQATLFAETQPTKYEAQLFERAGGDVIASAIAGAARAARLSFDATDDRTRGLVRVSTGVAAPLLTAFVLWTLEQARRDRVTRLYFLARDGQILTRLAQALATWAGVDIDCRYLLGSRQAFYLPSLPGDPAAAIDAALADSDGRLVGELLSELELDAGAAALVCDAAGLIASDRVSPETIASLRIGLAQPPILAVLRPRRAARAAALRTYLQGEAFFDPDVRSAIVDLGWKGNLQRRLELAGGGVGLRGYYYDLDRIPSDLRGTVETFANGAFRNAELLESFCMATHTSIRGFVIDDHGRAAPELDSWRDGDAATWGIDTQQTAIARFVENLTDVLPRELARPEDLLPRLRRAALAVFADLIEYPAPDEAAAYGSVRHARGQQHEDHAEIAPHLSGLALCRAMVSRAYRVRLNAWMQGAVMRSQDSLAGLVALGLLRLRQRKRASARYEAAAST
jgi:FMN phosphatase YigB (HAD superfamily)